MFRRICSTALLLAYLAIALASEAPWFCHDLDCPAFTQTTSADGLELRSYASNKWSSTVVNGTSLDDAMTTGFDRLFEYISGANDAQASIDMTAPVLVKVTPGAGPNCASSFKVSFFVPFKYQSPSGPFPPKPTSDLVFIETIEAMNVAVAEFSGFAQQKTIIAKAAEEEQLVANSTEMVASEGEEWFFAGYDPPFRLTNRHNEVFIPVEHKTKSHGKVTGTKNTGTKNTGTKNTGIKNTGTKNTGGKNTGGTKITGGKKLPAKGKGNGESGGIRGPRLGNY